MILGIRICLNRKTALNHIKTKAGYSMDVFNSAIEIFKMGSHMSLKQQGRPIVVTYSGGKDSDVLLEVAKASGEPFEVSHSHTTADAPQTVYHVRNKFKGLEEQGIKCTIEYPVYKGKRTSMWSLIPQKLMPPTRIARYCCAVLKETGAKGRVIATGVRWAESTKRKSLQEFEAIGGNKKNKVTATHEIMLMNDNDEKRKIIEHCQMKGKVVCNPIINMSDKEVWEILKDLKVEVNPLYVCGCDRVGCIGCPMAGRSGRIKEFSDFPKYKDMYIHSFQRMLEERKAKGKGTRWKTGEEVFLWWMEDENIEGQLSFDFDGNITDDLMVNY